MHPTETLLSLWSFQIGTCSYGLTLPEIGKNGGNDHSKLRDGALIRHLQVDSLWTLTALVRLRLE